MATITRDAKSGGGTDLGSGDQVLASELNTDFNTAYTEINGQLGDANMSSSQKLANDKLQEIAVTKVSDHAATDAAFLETGTSPGDSASVTAPTALDGDLEALRFRIAGGNHYTSGLSYENTGGTDTATDGWLEPPIVGRNLLPNPGFEVQSGGSGTAPDGWSLLGTPATLVLNAVAGSINDPGIDKRSTRITADAATEGITRTVTGLKTSTKYLFGVAYTLSTGSIQLSTTGALGSGDYQNLGITDATANSAIMEIKQGIVMTDSTPTDIVVRIHSAANLDDFSIYYAWFYELSDDAPIEAPHIPMQTATDATELEYPLSPSAGPVQEWDPITALSLSQYVPYEGYRLVYEVNINWQTSDTAPDSSVLNYQHSTRIQLDTGGGAATVEGPHVIYTEFTSGASANTSDSHSVAMKHIVENPTPGLTYAFTVDFGVYDLDGNGSSSGSYAWANLNPLLNSQQGASTAKLYTERI